MQTLEELAAQYNNLKIENRKDSESHWEITQRIKGREEQIETLQEQIFALTHPVDGSSAIVADGKVFVMRVYGGCLKSFECLDLVA